MTQQIEQIPKAEQVREIPLDIIDEPQMAARQEINQEELAELAASIKEIGIIQPILLKMLKGRYEIVAGHRRYLAAKMAGKVTIPAIVRAFAVGEHEIIKAHENLFRVNLNPVEEAINIMRLHQANKWEEKEIAKRLNMSLAWVNARVELLNYPEYMIELVRTGELSLGAAHWLFQIDDENVRGQYCKFAKIQGLSVKMAKAWVDSWSAGQLPGNPEHYIAPPDGGGEEGGAVQLPCIACGSEDVMENLVLDYVHTECAEKLKRVLADIELGGGNS